MNIYGEWIKAYRWVKEYRYRVIGCKALTHAVDRYKQVTSTGSNLQHDYIAKNYISIN